MGEVPTGDTSEKFRISLDPRERMRAGIQMAFALQKLCYPGQAERGIEILPDSAAIGFGEAGSLLEYEPEREFDWRISLHDSQGVLRLTVPTDRLKYWPPYAPPIAGDRFTFYHTLAIEKPEDLEIKLYAAVDWLQEQWRLSQEGQ